MDMRQTIIPKSDQLNADDLIAGPMTIKVTEVKIKGGPEQPVAIHFEGDKGKPYKPCKSMCRVMVAAWGADSSKYVGRSMTLYCDPKVKWAGMEVGGIRISHMTDIPESMTMALTVTRANKKPYTVKPLSKNAAPPPVPPVESEAGTSSGQSADGAAPDYGKITHGEKIVKEIERAPNLEALRAMKPIAAALADDDDYKAVARSAYTKREKELKEGGK